MSDTALYWIIRKMNINGKHKEKRNREKKDSFKVLFNSSPDAIFLADTETGVILDANLAAERLLGKPRKEIVGLHQSALHPKKQIQHSKTIFAKHLMEARKTGLTQANENFVVRADGSLVPVEIVANIMEYRGEKVLMGIFHDISNHVKAKEIIRQEIINLEELVTQRTLELEKKSAKIERAQKAMRYLLEDVNESRKDLEKTNRELLQANRELESFAYSISHDLRAPLRAVTGFSKILLQDYAGKLNAEGKELLQIMADNATRMSRMINDLLSLSRVIRSDMKLTTINMTSLARDIYNNLAVERAGKKYLFILDELPDARGDKNLLEHVWMNLLSNAIKYSNPREQPEIRVEGCQKDKQIIYAIHDNGVGFNPKYMHKLFGVFQRLHSGNEFEGNGVGLAIVQRIIQKHGGRVWAEGKLDQGAVFYFSLPDSS